jgi:hypothetical protein
MQRIPKPEIDKVRNYLRRIFLEARWNSSFSLRLAGTALEKADTIDNCITFYERIWSSEGSHVSVEDKELARKRWLKCRDRYALRLDEQKKTELSTDYFKQTEERARRWGIKLLDIPEYMGVSEADLPEIPRKAANRQQVPSVTEVQQTIIKASAAAGVKISDLASQFGLTLDEVNAILVKSKA